MAAAVGSSHRMLSYHFGSRDGVLVAVSLEVEARQRSALAALDVEAEPLEVMWRMWERLADALLWPHERLFYELYARALRGEEGLRPFLDGAIEPWLAPTEALFARLGYPRRQARAEARLALAVSRGLLLDLLATGDRKATDTAMRQYLRRYAS